jgi:hypothetical protein
MEAKTQENKTIEIRGPKNTDRRKPRRSDRRIYTEINSALTIGFQIPDNLGFRLDHVPRIASLASSPTRLEVVHGLLGQF